jgi:hypothetical protein
LKEAAEKHSDSWLAQQIRARRLMKTEEARRTPSGKTTTAKVPVTAPDTLAEGEFNRFFAGVSASGPCLKAKLRFASIVQSTLITQDQSLKPR